MFSGWAEEREAVETEGSARGSGGEIENKVTEPKGGEFQEGEIRQSKIQDGGQVEAST